MKRHITLLLGLLLVAAPSFAASEFAISFNSKKDFQRIQKSFYQAPIHGLNNLNNGTFKFLNTGATVHKILDKVGLVIVEAEDAETAQQLYNSKDFSVYKGGMIPSPILLQSTKRLIANATPLPASARIRPQYSGRQEDIKFDPVKDEFEGIPGLTWGLKKINAPHAWRVTRGRGVKVLVVDTGIDRDHPEVSQRFVAGKNFLESHGGKPAPYDYFDRDGHGTHVAGTVLAGNSSYPKRLKGVAPEASLYSGRVCGTLGCSTIGILSALDWGAQMGVHVINLSLGGPNGSPVAEQVYKTLRDQGIFVVAASGNGASSRGYVPGTVGFPASYSTVFAVGASDPDNERAPFSQYGKEVDVVAPGVEVRSSVPIGTGRESLVVVKTVEGEYELDSRGMAGSLDNADPIFGDIVYVGLGRGIDYQKVNVRGKIALIARGEITFSAKASMAVAKGAIAVMMHNNTEGLISGDARAEGGGSQPVPVSMISLEDGEWLQQTLRKNQRASAGLSVAVTDHVAFDGTSMATPHVAGLAALVISANPRLSPQQVGDIIKKTSIPLGKRFETGAGLVNAQTAVTQAKRYR